MQWIGILVTHIKQSNYSSSFIRPEHVLWAPTCPYLMLNYLRLRWSISLTDASLIECCSYSWWVCYLASCLSLPPLPAWRCKNLMALRRKHEYTPCRFAFVCFVCSTVYATTSAIQCKSFLRLFNASECILLYGVKFLWMWVQWMFAFPMLIAVRRSNYCAEPHK